MSKQLKIAYCIPSLYYPSGMERVLTLKANYFSQVFGYEIHIILTDGKNKEPYYELDPSIRIHQLDINYDDLYELPLHKRLLRYLQKQSLFQKRLSKCLNEIKPNITISLLRREINFIGNLKDGSIKLGEIHFNRSNYRDFHDNHLPVFFQKIIKSFWIKQLIKQLKKLETFIVLTNEDALEWTELSNVKVIHNPLPFLPEKQSNLENKQVIAVGRYMPQKGFDRLIDAWKIVSQKHPDWVLKIYGDGMRDKLQEQINRLNIKQSCVLEHSVSDIVEKYCESSIFTLSSRFEGFGMVIIEAMACGVPPVSFDCPCGPKDIIEDKKNGLLVPNGDVLTLADKICFLIENKDIRKTMGNEAKKSVQKFQIDRIASQWKNLFENIVEKT
ncbi:MAG: glycosyltransferase family 4 protein [Erysipelotrichia bacterium]|nr:glycosyltransferase family 4 protein [Erysipelotrichia bacterium]